MSQPAQRAFTLIEILVVVAIIALLIAILLPALAVARDQAQTMVCKTRLRELYRGHLYYAHDNKQYFPHFDWWLWDGYPGGESQITFYPGLYAKVGGVRPTDSSRWVEFGQIYRYVKDKEVYFCSKDPKLRGASAIGGGSNGKKPITSYSRVFEPHYLALWHKKNDRSVWSWDGVVDSTDFLTTDSIKPSNMGAEAAALVGVPCTTTPDHVGLLFEEWPNAEGDTLNRNTDIALNDGYSGPLVASTTDFFAMRHRQHGHVMYWDGHAALADKRVNNYPTDRTAAVVLLGASRR